MHLGVLIVGIILVFAMLAGGFLAASAAKEISAFDYEGNATLKSAHGFAAGAASIDFIVGLVAIGAAIYLAFKEMTKDTTKVGILGVLVILGLIAAGVLAILGAQKCGEWLDTHPSDSAIQLAKTNLAWSSAFSFVTLFLVIVGLGLYTYFGKKEAAAHAAAAPTAAPAATTVSVTTTPSVYGTPSSSPATPEGSLR